MEADASTSLPSPAVGRRTVAHVVAASLVALGLLAVTATAVAAADPTGDATGSPTDVVVETADGAAEPFVEVVEPAVEPILEPLGPVVEALEPLMPTLPVVPALPTSPTHPVRPDGIADLAVGTDGRAIPTRPAFLDLGAHAEPMARPSPATVSPAATATAVSGGTETGQSVDVIVLDALVAAVHDATLTLDAGTTLVAGMLSGFVLAATAAWTAMSGPMRLRPMGLRLTPPVPPG